MIKLTSCRLVFFLFLFISFSVNAQSFSWATQLKGSASKQILAGATDQAGNIYSVGRFLGVVDFDPGPGSYNLNAGAGSFSDDIFVLKQSPDGTLVWAYQFGSDYSCIGTAICVGPSGDLYIAGRFQYTVDFDPGPGLASLTANSSDDVFVLRLTSGGKFVWVKQISGDLSIDYVDNPHLAMDAVGNVFLNVNYGGTFDFDPGPGVYNLSTSGATLDPSDIAICKLSPSGNFVWAQKFGSPSTERVHSINVDYEGNILLAGYITGQVDFDGGAGVYNVGVPNNIESFVGKFNTDGQPIWVKGLDAVQATCIDKDRQNNYYVGSVASLPQDLMRIFKLNSDGTELWKKTIEPKQCCTGGDIAPTGLVVDSENHFYVACEYVGVMDFDPGPAVYQVDGVSGYDVALAHFTDLGELVWANHFGGIHEDRPTFLLLDPTGNLVVGGRFSHTVDFDPGPAVNNLTSLVDPLGDLFIAKFSKANYITGNVFQDANGDGLRQASEPNLSNIIIKGNRGQRNYFGITDSSGRYKLMTDTGSYTVSLSSPQYYTSIVPATHNVNFGSATGVLDTGNHFALTPAHISAIRITITPLQAARPGLITAYRITYTNTGTDLASGTITAVHDSRISLDAASPAPVSILSPVLKWDFFNLAPSVSKNIDMWFRVPAQIELGATLKSYAEADPLTGTFEPVNLSDTVFHIVTGSFDPNDKEVSPDGNIEPGFISSRQSLDYTIRYQNTGTDTAFNIKIIDTLSSNAEIESFQMLSASHSYAININGDGIVEWRFDNILLPDSNRNETRSHGFVRYRIKPRSGMSAGQQVKNRAAIYFDYNVPVLTNETINTVTVITAVNPGIPGIESKIFPNPSNTSLFLRVNGYFFYTVYDITGKVVKVSGRNYNEAVIGTSTFPKGIYFVEVKTLQGRAIHKILVN